MALRGHSPTRFMSVRTDAFRRALPSLLPAAGCGVFAAASLSIYLRDLRLQAGCAGSIVCGDFQADPKLLVAGVGFAVLALALAGASIAVARAARSPPGSRTRAGVRVSLGMALSFAALLLILTLNGTSPAANLATPLAIWTFIGIGYCVLWFVAAFPSALVGAWRAAQGLALVHGAIAMLATAATAAYALGPGPLFL